MQKSDISINYTETLVGYDIRITPYMTERLRRIFDKTETVSPRLRDNDIWLSRFYGTGESSWDTLVLTHFREPIGKDSYYTFRNVVENHHEYIDRIAVPYNYSWQYSTNELWDNPANMLCRYVPGFDGDIFVAFTALDIFEPHVISCKGEDITHSDFRESLIMTPPEEAVDLVKQYPDFWKLLGYDVCDEHGFSPFISYGEEMQKDLDRENYTPWVNRNNYLLFNTIESEIGWKKWTP